MHAWPLLCTTKLVCSKTKDSHQFAALLNACVNPIRVVRVKVRLHIGYLHGDCFLNFCTENECAPTVDKTLFKTSLTDIQQSDLVVTLGHS